MNIDKLIILCIASFLIVLTSTIGGCVIHQSNRTLETRKITYGLMGEKLSEEKVTITYPLKKYMESK